MRCRRTTAKNARALPFSCRRRPSSSRSRNDYRQMMTKRHTQKLRIAPTMANERRRFLRATGALSAGALFPALAWAPSLMAQVSDYRALVCVFLYGGNDGNNTVVPYDDYASYAAGRGGAAGAAGGRDETVGIAAT